MAYDEELAARVRDVLAVHGEFAEQAMFGGLAFLVNTHMACGLMKDGLMVRVGKPGHADAISRGAEVFGFPGRPMRGIVLVPDRLVADEETLESWIAEGVAFARSEPPKKPKRPPA